MIAMVWQKGQSGNPKGGRPKDVVELKYLAQVHSIEAIDRLVYWMRNSNPKASVAACSILLDRGYGKPEQSIEVSKIDPFKNVTADDVRQFRDRLTELRGNRQLVTIDGTSVEAPKIGALPALSEAEVVS